MDVDLPANRDLQLLKQVAGGDEDALAVLYQRFSTPLFNFVLRLVNDRAVAEDLVQDVFIAAWKNAARFRGHSSVKTWLFRIGHYQAVSWLRKNIRPANLEGDPAPAQSDLEEHSQAEWLRGEVNRVLDQLSDEHKAVVELTFFQGMSYSEISEVLDCPVGTVKSRMSYARKILNETLRSVHAEYNDLLK